MNAHQWPVGGAIFHLNGTDAELWPTVLDESAPAFHLCPTGVERLGYKWCPSAGFAGLEAAYNRWWVSVEDLQFQVNDAAMTKKIYVKSHEGIITDTWAYTSHGPTASLQNTMLTYYLAAASSLEVWSPNSPLAAPPVPMSTAEVKLFQVNTQVPLVRALCWMQNPIVSDNVTIPTTMFQFPRLTNDDYRATGSKELLEMDVTESLRHYLDQRNMKFESAADLTKLFDLGTVVIPVRLEDAGADVGKLGLVMFQRHMHTGALDDTLAPVDILACSIDARWAQGRTIQRFDLTTGSPQGHPPRDSYNMASSNLVQTELGWDNEPPEDEDDGGGSKEDTILSSDKPNTFPQIDIHPSWSDLASPFFDDEADLSRVAGARHPDYENPFYPPRNRTYLDRMMEERRFPTRVPGIEQGPNNILTSTIEVTLASIYADAISRSGWTYHTTNSLVRSNTNPPSAPLDNTADARAVVRHGEPSAEFLYPPGSVAALTTPLTLRAFYKGYVMAITGKFDGFCVALLAAHAAVALLHTLWALRRRRAHSGAWESVPQLVALSQQSPPEEGRVLGNACAGVSGWGTVRRVVTVECCRDGGGDGYGDVEAGGGEELRLRVGEGWREWGEEKGRGERGPVPGREYGMKGR